MDRSLANSDELARDVCLRLVENIKHELKAIGQQVDVARAIMSKAGGISIGERLLMATFGSVVDDHAATAVTSSLREPIQKLQMLRRTWDEHTLKYVLDNTVANDDSKGSAYKIHARLSLQAHESHQLRKANVVAIANHGRR